MPQAQANSQDNQNQTGRARSQSSKPWLWANFPPISGSRLSRAVAYNKSRGYSRARVRGLQNALGVGDDGIIGPNTTKAVWAFQHYRSDLTADGMLGPKTAGALTSLNTGTGPGQGGQAGQGGQEQQGNGEPARPSGPVPDGNITSNFAWSEFRSKGDGVPVPPELRPNVRALCEQLEILRASFGGRSISVNSGYRSPYWNGRVGGAPGSQHKFGRAADFNVSGVAPSTVRARIEELIAQGRMQQGGLGRYRTFTHYDIRGYRARWSG